MDFCLSQLDSESLGRKSDGRDYHADFDDNVASYLLFNTSKMTLA